MQPQYLKLSTQEIRDRAKQAYDLLNPCRLFVKNIKARHCFSCQGNSYIFANNIFSMTMASDGSAWIGSFGGVARIKTGELQ